MRPRLFAAEIPWRRTTTADRSCSFNEAAAFRRGNHLSASWSLFLLLRFNEAAAFRRGNHVISRRRRRLPTSFNEAAAFRRGNQAGPGDPLAGLPASMRPRLFAAEIGNSRESLAAAESTASMRPRLFAAEIPIQARTITRHQWRFNEAAAFRRGNLNLNP